MKIFYFNKSIVRCDYLKELWILTKSSLDPWISDNNRVGYSSIISVFISIVKWFLRSPSTYPNWLA